MDVQIPQHTYLIYHGQTILLEVYRILYLKVVTEWNIDFHWSLIYF